MYKPEIDIKRTEDVEITRSADEVRANFPLVGGCSRVLASSPRRKSGSGIIQIRAILQQMPEALLELRSR